MAPLVLLLLLYPGPGDALIPTAVVTACTFMYKAYEFLSDANDAYQTLSSTAPSATLDDVLDSVNDISKSVDALGDRLSAKLDDVYRNMLKELPEAINIDATMREMSRYVTRVDNWYRKFEGLVQNKARFNNKTFTRFANTVTSDDAHQLSDVLNTLSEIVVPQRTGAIATPLLTLIGDRLKQPDSNDCDTGLPPHGSLYDIYVLLMITEIRGFVMTSFSYVILGYYEDTDYMGEVDFSREQMIRRTETYMREFTKAGNLKPAVVRRCNPPEGYVRDETFSEFARFRTRYPINQMSMFDPPKCNFQCKDVMEEATRHYQCDETNGCTVETKCRGRILNCENFVSYMRTCPADDPWGPRRYLKFGNRYGYRYGGYGKTCDNEKVMHTTSGPDGSTCSNCVCDCVEDDYSSFSRRVVSFREQIADISSNKVVTGIKFAITDNMTHIQIQQGQVTYQGLILTSTVEWKPLENIVFDHDETVAQEKLIFHIDDGDNQLTLEENKDFGAFALGEDTINLDDLVVPKDYVITDTVRFAHEEGEGSPAIQLEVHATPYDFLLGVLIPSDDYPSVWLKPSGMKGVVPEYDGERQRYPLVENPTNPIENDYEEIEPLEIAKPNTYMILEPTSFQQDGGQMVVPLMDIQPVYGGTPFALGGVGLFHKAVSIYEAGFLALHIRPIDSLKYLQVSDNDS